MTTRRLPLDGLVEEAAHELDEHKLGERLYRRKRADERVSRLRTKHDPLAGLMAAQEALANHDYVPRLVAQWLSQGIGMYLSGRYKSLDAALGLKKAGRAHPLRKAKEDHALRAALSEMYWLNLLGATITQAAALVHTTSPGHAVNTLIDRYRRGGYSEGVKEMRKLGMPFRGGDDPDRTLAKYPDADLEVRQAKAAVRAVYAKRRP